MASSKPTHLGHFMLLLTALFSLLASETECRPTQINRGTKGKFPLLLIPRSSNSNTTHTGTYTDASTAANPNVEITIHNTLNTNKILYVYITGIPNTTSTSTSTSGPDTDTTSGLQAILRADSGNNNDNTATATTAAAATWDVLNAHGSEIPVNITTNVAFRVPAAYNSTTTLTLPSYVAAARLYIVEGAEMPWQQVSTDDGASTSIVQPVATTPGTTAYDHRWGFVEFTSGDEEFFVNLSFVDFVSLGLGISVVDDRTGVEYVVPGLSPTLKALEEAAEAADGSAHASSESLLPPPTYRNGTTAQSRLVLAKKRSEESAAAAAIVAPPVLVTNTTTADVLEAICASLQAQAQKDGNAWDKLCIYSNTTTTSEKPTVLRILSPQDGLQQDIPFASPTYFETYISRVWAHYTTTPLYIDTQNPDLGTLNSTLVPCTVDPATDALLCAGATTPMPRPSTSDLWGCNTGAFAINDTAEADDVFRAVVPRVCAAFVRSTLLLPTEEADGSVQPGPANSTYYQNEVTNHYARILHEHEGVGGYAFPYDDVGVYGENEEGAIQVASARKLDIWVG